MATPDDVQAAAHFLADKTTDEEAVRVAAVGRIYDVLVELDWTPPGPSAPLQEAYDAGFEDGRRTFSPVPTDPEYKTIYAQGWSDGIASTSDDRKVITTSPDAWVPVALRWRFVKIGDVFVDDDALWMVCHIGPHNDGWGVSVTEKDRPEPVDPDEEVDVLLPAVEADAIKAARELGGQMIDRS